jgi:lipoprotein-releasing system permease protein
MTNPVALLLKSRVFRRKSLLGNSLYKKMKSSVIGVALGLIPFIVIIVLSTGMIQGILDRYQEISSFHLQIRGIGRPDSETLDKITQSVIDSPMVRNARIVYTGKGLLSSKTARIGVEIKSFPEDVQLEDPGLFSMLKLVDGSFDFTSKNTIHISQSISDDLGISVGDRVILLTPQAGRNEGTLYRPQFQKVGAVFQTGYHDLDQFTVYISPSSAQGLFNEPGQAIIGIKLDDAYDAEKVKTMLQESEEEILPPGYRVYTWREIERTMIQGFTSTQQILYVVMGLIVIVAVFNISSNMYILILEDAKEIAILLALGLSKKQISTFYLLIGTITGISGSLLGLLLGLIISLLINPILRIIEFITSVPAFLFGTEAFTSSSFYLESIPLVFPLDQILLAALIPIAMSVIASYLPSRRAASTKPAVIFQHHA